MNGRRITTWSGLLAVALLATAPAARDRGMSMSETRISVPGKVAAVHLEDVDGDGAADLVMLAGGRLRIHRGGAALSAGSPPQLDVAFPAGAQLYDLGDIDGDGALELAVMDGAGVRGFRMDLEGGSLKALAQPLVSQQTIFRGGEVVEPSRCAFLIDLRGAGVLDCIVPQSSKLWIYEGDGKGRFTSPHVIVTAPSGGVAMDRPWTRISGQDPSATFKATARVPRIIAGEAGGDPKQKDLLVIRGEDVSTYLRDTSGRLPVVAGRPFHVPDPPQDDRRRMRLLSLPVLAGDLDGDGRTDLVTFDSAGGTAACHLQQATGRWGDRPDALVRVKGWLVGGELADLDGDGRQDLLLVRIDEMSIWDALSVITSMRLPVELAVYLSRGEGIYAERAAFAHAADIPLRISGEGVDSIRVEAGFTPSPTGDHDGDGVVDMTVATGRGALEIVGKRGDAGWATIATLKVDGLEEFRTVAADGADLDGDGKDDLVLICRSWDQTAAPDEVRVLSTR